MSEGNDQQDSRRPQAFSLEENKVVESREHVFDDHQDEQEIAIAGSREVQTVKRSGWGAVFLGAIGGLVILSLVAWLTSFVSALFFRNDLIGYISLGLMGLAGFSGVMLLVYEVVSLVKLRRLGEYRKDAELALEERDLAGAQKVVRSIEKLFSDREDLGWSFARFREQRQDILDADQLLILLEREVVSGVDQSAKEVIVSTARRVAAITTISPAPLLDVFIVAYYNLGLLRQIASLYGGRPGLYGSLKLGRMVITHLTLSGGVALTSDIIQQLMGQKLAAKISTKLGEGLFNGTMTARIGIAATEVCRPLPYINVRKPGLREVAGAILSGSPKT